MKKIITSVEIGLVLLCLCLAFPTEIPAPASVPAATFSAEKYIGPSTDLAMTVVSDRITPDTGELTLLLVNHSGEYQTYGRIFYLEREEKGQWLPVTPLPGTAFEEIAIMLPSDKANEETLDIGTCYGSLRPGAYRVVKTFGDTYAIAEFQVTEV
ncbi:immunoglobulin-like domain-containing protein [Eubacterium sp. 1001713B170207_170306_E7]|uniref:immunoglobulin-like domain-containing protein n=1 Tax=Eubacterium sp. 1001713B170207_170306_E7 TaxID=2787097 RepID=UPI00189AC17C|nr:immunoglobulin-like domain-containing protein [Eubacterium sp. 1001713B170207_170306_E7]